jgi:hypothetical protein
MSPVRLGINGGCPIRAAGQRAKREELLKRIRKITESHGQPIGVNPWTGRQPGFDGFVAHGARNHWKSHHHKDLTYDCIDRVVEFGGPVPSDEIEGFIPHMEGGPSRVTEDDMAYAHRRTPFVLKIHTRWRSPSGDEKCLAWVHQFHRATEQLAEGVYVSFLSDEGEACVRQAYAREVWERLVAVKNRWDPTNLSA